VTMPIATVVLAVGAGRLVVQRIRSLGDVRLSDHSGPNQRLIILAPDYELLDDGGMAYSCFERAIGPRGLLTCANSDDLDSFVTALVMPAIVGARWLTDDDAPHIEVTVAAFGPHIALVAATMLVAGGRSPPEAIAAVEQVLPDSFNLDLEVGVSVARDRVAEHRAFLKTRRP
jgi:hypothetical protein